MKQRVITAVVALALFIPIIIAGGVWIEIAAALLALLGMSEIFIMRKRIIISLDFLLSAIGVIFVVLPDSLMSWLPGHLTRMDAIYIIMLLLLLYTVGSKNKFTYDDASVLLLSMLYIGFGFRNLIAVRNDGGLDTLMFALGIVWLTDSGAYIVGRAIGKHKMWPAISPNKTWEGSIGGNLVALIFAAIYLVFLPQAHGFWTMMLIALILSVAGSLGDLIESGLKRYYGVKDSGKILPGHGGILDRFDSLLVVLPLMHLFALV